MAEYIEREKAIKIIDRIFDLTDPTGDEQIGVLKCRNAIREKTPAADVAEVRRGKWDKNNNCTACGTYKFEGLDADVWANWDINYCPNCGAKMDLEGEE